MCAELAMFLFMRQLTVEPLRFQNALYVPHLRRNLIFTSRLTEKHVAIIHVRDEYKLISRDFHMTSIFPYQYSSYRCR